MKNIIYFLILILLLASCKKTNEKSMDSKKEMRDFVINISKYAKAYNPKFIVIPQNGIELVTMDGTANSPVHTDYVNAIDGNGQEDLFYGYDNDDKETPNEIRNYLRSFLDVSKNHGNTILVTNYCSTFSKMEDSYNLSYNAGYVSFAANNRELTNIPDYPNPIFAENDSIITSLSEVKNFLYLINPEKYPLKSDFIDAIKSTNYDLLIMDLFSDEGDEFTASEIDQLKNKANGGKRLVIAYMSIGEAEIYRYYWQSVWNLNLPSWIDGENPDWAGNFKVKYWKKGWQEIIFGNDDSYLKKILNANFDGVYLDIIDAFEYYE